MHVGRDNTFIDFIGNTMSAKKRTSATAEFPITGIINVALPFPAIIGGTWSDIFPKQLFRYTGGAMAQAKTSMLTTDKITFSVCIFRYWCYLATAAFAIFGVCCDFVAWHIVSANELDGLTDSPSAFLAAIGGDSCFLSTSAVAITVWDFCRRLFCGMIIHADTFLLRFGHSAGLLAQSLRPFCLFTQV